MLFSECSCELHASGMQVLKEGGILKGISTACACTPIIYVIKLACMMPRTGLHGACSTVAECGAIVGRTSTASRPARHPHALSRYTQVRTEIRTKAKSVRRTRSSAPHMHSIKSKFRSCLEVCARTIDATTSSTQEVSGSFACLQCSQQGVAPALTFRGGSPTPNLAARVRCSRLRKNSSS